MPTAGVLRRMLYDFKVGWEALRGTATILAQGAYPSADGSLQRIAYNAVIESFALHVRDLIEFLTFAPDGKHHVRAGDFLAAGMWVRAGRMNDLACLAHKQACDQIAHLTFARAKTTGPVCEWDLRNICEYLETQLNEFRSKLLAGRIYYGDPLPSIPAPFTTEVSLGTSDLVTSTE